MKTNRAPFWDFDRRIFSEGFRQLKLFGILSTVIICIAAVLLPIGEWISSQRIHYVVDYNSGMIEESREVISALEMQPLVLLPIYTMALFMPLIVFSFLNKRNASDHYHALPTSRAGVFISLFTAVMAWITIAVVSSTALATLVYLCLSHWYQITFSTILPLILTVLCGSFMVAACVSLAMTITGNLFNNLLVSAMLFFGPRILIWFAASLIDNAVHIINDMMDTPILDIRYNIPLGILYGVLEGNYYGIILDNFAGCLYSAVIGAAFFIAALALFRARHSEAAERPAAIPALQSVYRIFFTFLISLIPTFIIFDCLQDEIDLHADELFTIFFLYVITALAFCLYELVTTRKPKNLVKAIPGFIIVLVADAVMIAAIQGGVHSILAFRPTPDEITAVSFTSEIRVTNNKAYFQSLTKNIRISDEGVRRAVSEQLASAAEENYPGGTLDDVNDELLVTIHTKNGSRTRRLYFNDTATSLIRAALYNNEQYAAAYTLPALSHAVSVNIDQLQLEQARNVYRQMREEINSLPLSQRQNFLQQPNNEPSQAVNCQIVLTISQSGKTHHLSSPVSSLYCPKAYEMALQYLHDNQMKQRQNALDALQEAVNTTKEFSLRFELKSDTGFVYNSFWLDQTTITNFIREELSNDIIPYLDHTPITPDDYVLNVYIWVEGTNEADEDVAYHKEYTAMFAVIDQDLIDAISECTLKAGGEAYAYITKTTTQSRVQVTPE